MYIYYKVFFELNMLAMIELIKASKNTQVKYFIYVVSIAAANHFAHHDNAYELTPKPY